MALPVMIGTDGRRALPAFTSLAALAAWDPAARPVPVPTATRGGRRRAGGLLVPRGRPGRPGDLGRRPSPGRVPRRRAPLIALSKSTTFSSLRTVRQACTPSQGSARLVNVVDSRRRAGQLVGIRRARATLVAWTATHLGSSGPRCASGVLTPTRIDHCSHAPAATTVVGFRSGRQVQPRAGQVGVQRGMTPSRSGCGAFASDSAREPFFASGPVTTCRLSRRTHQR